MSIRIRNLQKAYGTVEAVRNISLDVAAGEIYALLGPNGAGKSTTLGLLTTVLAPTGGSIELMGLDPVTNSAKVRRRIGVIFQDETLDQELSVLENMELHAGFYGIGRDECASRSRELLEDCGLWDRRSTIVRTLSGGTRRRLEAARAFLTSPEILFMDEPTVGMDAQSRNWFWLRIRNLNQGSNTTIFFATHQLDEAQGKATRIAIIDHGRLVAEGSCAAILQRSNAISLEGAYLDLTGTELRNDGESAFASIPGR